MPKAYDATAENDIVRGALPCLGGTVQEAWERGRCLGFEFGRDRSTGLGVALVAACDDVCPSDARLDIVLADRLSALECRCLAYQERMTAGWGGYIGCAPVSVSNSGSSTSGTDFTACAVRTPGAHRDEFHVDVKPRSRLYEMGLENDVVIEAVNGVAVQSPDDVTRVLEALPERVPGSIRFRRGRATQKTYATELHFIAREVVDELRHTIDGAHVAEIPSRSSTCLSGPNRIQLGIKLVSYDPKCADEVVLRLERVAAAIRRAARTAKDRAVARRELSTECDELASLPIQIGLWEGDRFTELRYVDWMVR